MQGPHPALATTFDDVIEGERSHGLPRQFTSLPMGGLDRRDRVALRQAEGTIRRGRDADLGVGAARDGLIEPDSFDVRDVLEQPEEGGPRRHESEPCFLLAEIMERVVQRRPIAVDEFVEAYAEICRPLVAPLLTARIGHHFVLARGDGCPERQAPVGPGRPVPPARPLELVLTVLAFGVMRYFSPVACLA